MQEAARETQQGPLGAGLIQLKPETLRSQGEREQASRPAGQPQVRGLEQEQEQEQEVQEGHTGTWQPQDQ